MNYRFNLLFLYLLFFTVRLSGQELVSATLLGTKTQAQLYAQFGVPFIQFGAKYFRITYTTPDVQGITDTVSGLLVVPDNPNKVYPRLVYQHGTSGSKQDVPSVKYNTGNEGSVGLLFGGLGYVALLPDYLGLGVSGGFHPYLHAESEAWVAADMLRASTEFELENGIQTNGQLFITGYSQGGHSAMALHREIENNLSGEFTVTAAAPMSGPYSVGEVMRDLILNDEVYYFPAYIPNTFLSYQTVYGNIFNQITDLFKPVYADYIEKFYNNEITLTQLNSQLIAALTANEGASRPFKMFQDSIIQVVINNPDHPINMALQANNTYNNWIPQAPMRLFYCMADDQVPFENSIVARDSLLAAGASDLQALDVAPAANHGDCYVPAITNTVIFFLNFQQIGDVSAVSAVENSRLQLFPNPASDFITLDELPAKGQLMIVNYYGQIVKSITLGQGNQSISTDDLPDGVYFARYQAKGESLQEKLIIQH